MKKVVGKIICALCCLAVVVPEVSAKRHAVRAHYRHYKNGTVVRVSGHTRTSKNK